MQRNKNLDILKAISVYCVISAHTTVVFLQDYWYSIMRIAVPLFFMISGFYSKDSVRYNLKRIFKCMSLLIICESLYLLLFWLYKEDYKFEYLKLQKFENVVTGNFMIWNYGWYLLSLAYIYILNILISKIRYSNVIMFILVILGFFALFYGEGINKMQSDILKYTHVVAKGIPFFFGARLLKRFDDKINIPVNYVKAIVVVSTIIVLIQRYFLLANDGGGRYVYIGTPFMVFGLFYIAIRSDSYNMPFFAFIGKNLSMYMYCIHLALIDIFFHLNIECESFSLYFASAAVSYIMYIIVNFIKIKKSMSFS